MFNHYYQLAILTLSILLTASLGVITVKSVTYINSEENPIVAKAVEMINENMGAIPEANSLLDHHAKDLDFLLNIDKNEQIFD